MTLLIAVFLLVGNIPEPEKGEIEKWLLSACAVMAMVALGKKIFIRKPPVHEQFADKAETNERFDQVDAQLDEIRKQVIADKERLAEKIDSAVNRLTEEGSRRAANINKRVDTLGQEVIGEIGQLKGVISQMNERLKER